MSNKKHISESYISHILQDIITEMTAYHGSGGEFKKFDSSFNGSGEGSSAFGPGHYFTSSKSIGKDYANEHGTSQIIIPNIEYNDGSGDCIYQSYQLYHKLDKIIPIGKYDEENNHIIWQTTHNLMSTSSSTQDFIHKLYPLLVKTVKSQKDYNEWKEWYSEDLIKALHTIKGSVRNKQRYLYQVEIPDENKYADWNMEVPEEWYSFISSVIETSENADIMFEKANDIINRCIERNNIVTIGDLYYSLHNMYPDATFGDNLFKYTLKKYGYVGVKYPSGTIYKTSSTKNGDMNYTVFDDDNIKITNRWDY